MREVTNFAKERNWLPCFSKFVPKAFIQNLVQNGSVVSEKIRFEFLYVHDLGQRSRNEIPLFFW